MSKITLGLSVDADKFDGLVARLAGAGIEVDAAAQVIPTLDGCRSANVVTGRTADRAIDQINDHLDAYCPDCRQITLAFADMRPPEKAAFLDFATHDCIWTDEDDPAVDDIPAEVYERFRADWPRLFLADSHAYPAAVAYLVTIEPERVDAVRQALADPGVQLDPRRDLAAVYPDDRYPPVLFTMADGPFILRRIHKHLNDEPHAARLPRLKGDWQTLPFPLRYRILAVAGGSAWENVSNGEMELSAADGLDPAAWRELAARFPDAFEPAA